MSAGTTVDARAAAGPVAAREVGGGAAAAREPGLATLLLVLTAVFMTVLDFFVVNVAIPSMERDLHAGRAAVEWVVAGYGLVYGAGLVTGGRLGDLYGRRRMFGVGLAAFTLASVACGLAPTAGSLVAARMVQGGAAALLAPQILALLRTLYSGAAQARAFGGYGITLGLAAVFGQLAGGLLIHADLFGLGWRACFLVNLPVGTAALLLTRRLVPHVPTPGRARLDLPGVVLLTAAVAALILPLIDGREQGWPAWIWISFAASAVLFPGFVWWQWRLTVTGGDPLLHLGLFRERAFTTGLLTQLAVTLGQAAYFLVLALYLQQGRGLGALGAGLAFTPMGAGYMLTSTTANRITARLGRQVITAGALTRTVALLLLTAAVAHVGNGGNYAWLVAPLVLDGMGMGMLLPPLVSIVLARVPSQHAGAASGALSTTTQVGLALGVAVIGIIFFGAADDGTGRSAVPDAFTASLVYLVGITVLTAAMAQILPRRHRTTD